MDEIPLNVEELRRLRKQLKGALNAVDKALGPKKVQSKPKAATARWGDVEGLCEESWRRWLAYRKEIGAPAYKTIGVASKLVDLAKASRCEQAEIVNQSIENEWRGLFFLKQGFKSKGQDEPERDFL